MAYSYYLVSYAKGTTKEISTNVYEASEDSARVVGAALLTEYYELTVNSAAVVVEEVAGLTSDTITTT